MNNLSESNNTNPEREYSSIYYTPRPRTGAKGGSMGRGPVKKEDMKTQYNMTLSNKQKEEYTREAEKEGMPLYKLINKAVDYYIMDKKNSQDHSVINSKLDNKIDTIINTCKELILEAQKSERINGIKRLIKENIDKEFILKLGYNEEEYNDAINSNN